jgi:hypothetical protein
MKFIVDTLCNKEIIKKKSSFFFHENSKFKGSYSKNCCATVVNLVTYDAVDDQNHKFLVL